MSRQPEAAIDRGAMRASTLELFFDLVFVFAITQVSVVLRSGHELETFGRGLLLLVMLWWTWTVYAWITNFTGTTGTGTRLSLIGAMGATLVMATAVTDAFGDQGLWFAGALFLVRTLGQVGYWVGTAGNAAVRQALKTYLPLAFVAPTFFLVGGIVDDPWRTWLWLIGIAVDMASAASAGRGEWDVAATHFAERHGLFVIIALGESIVAIGFGAVGVERSTSWLFAIGIAFAGTAALWWSYFDHIAERGEHYLIEADRIERGRFARDGYSLLHFPIIAGIVLFAVAAEAVVAHPDDILSTYDRWLFATGIALVLLGMAAATYRALRRIPIERLVVGGGLMAVAQVVTGTSAVTFAAICVLLLVVTLVLEGRRTPTTS